MGAPPQQFDMDVGAQMDADIGGAEGIGPPPQSEMQAMLQMMNMQMSNMQQMFTAMMAAQTVAANAATAAANIPGSNLQPRESKWDLDERHFRRLDKFSNQAAKWKDWRTHFLTSVRESCPPFAK